MSILIKGIEMPKGHPVCIIIDAAGQARRYDLNNDRYADDKLFEAVPVPPHGDLIDRDALMDSDGDLWDGMWGWSGVKIANAPTIIPAEEVYDKYTDTAGNFHWCGTHSGKHIAKAEEYKE